MNKEQNIDDILKLLKDSVTTFEPTSELPEVVKSEENISADVLKEQLINQYISESDNVSSENIDQSEYVIDSEFLSEAVEEKEDTQPITETEEPKELIIEQLEMDIGEPTVENQEMPPIFEVVPEIDPVLTEDSESEFGVIEQTAIEFDSSGEGTETIIVEKADEPIEELEEETELQEQEVVVEETEEQVQEAIVKEEQPTAPPEPHETFLASMRKIGIDFTTEDIYKNSVSHDEPLEEEISDEPIIDEPLDPSTVNLMMQFCDKEELEETIGNKNVDDFLRFEQQTVQETTTAPVVDGREYNDASQNDKIRERYKSQSSTKLLKLIGCAIIALVAFVYELFPLIDVRFSGVLDYYSNPAVYALIGLQFVVLAAAIRYKEFWKGLKRAFSSSPTYESLVAVIMALTAFYDVITVIVVAISGDTLPNMYNAIAVFALTVAALYDYLSTATQMWAFSVYSSELPKFTLHKETQNGSIGAKMYGGGLEKDKTIYSVRTVDFPNGFFRSVSKKQNRSKLLTWSVIPVLVIGMIAAVISAFTNPGEFASFASIVVCIYALMPIALILVDIVPAAVVCRSLSKKGSAFAGAVSAEKYADADVIVFSDLHIFKKCKTEDIGIAVYDTKVGYLTLGCIDALYKKIGGPMSGMQMNLPDVFKFDHVVLKRVAQNGIDAVVDKRHSIVVGTPEFMQRYGLSFPKNETQNDRLTLCVSLNGGVTAKLSVKYNTESVFEMLAQRLSAEGIACAVRTLDPLINSTMIASSRTLGNTPISVIHGNSADLSESENARYDTTADGVICCSSRLKLAQVAVMLKRLKKVRRICTKICAAFAGIGFVAIILLLAFSVMPYVNQMLLFAYIFAELVLMGVIMLIYLPTNKYFTVDALYSELEKKYQKENKEEQKETNE